MTAERKTRFSRAPWTRVVAGALASALAVAGAAAQTVEFEQLLHARETTALLEQDGVVIGGIAGGGLVFWPVSDPAGGERLTSGSELSGNDVTDLAWSGRHVWVATRGGGLTLISDVGGQREFRQYASNRNSLNVTSVAGVLVGQSERVYYGLDGGGVGLITDGVPGSVYTTNDGLVSDEVTTVQVLDGVLFVGTPVGISRFANNLFTAVNDGLTDLLVHDLALESDGRLLAGTEGGLFRWDPDTETWSVVGGMTGVVSEISCVDGLIYARIGVDVRVYDGSTWRTLSKPAGTVGAIHAGSEFWIGGTFGVNQPGEFTVRDAYLGRLVGATNFDVWTVEASQVQSPAGAALAVGRPYLGAQLFEPVISSREDGIWSHLRYQASDGSNDGQRLGPGIVLAMDRGPGGEIWATLYAGTGLARFDPTTGVIDLMSPTTSGLEGIAIINVRAHLDGPVITMHDQEDFAKVEILVDPDNWSLPASWLALPREPLGAVDATDINDAVVERRDVVWFTVSEVGLVRWDINGVGAGPDEPLTWFDLTDDSWITVDALPNTTLDLGAAFALELGADGTIWVGGNGLLQFSYDEATGAVETLTSMAEKGSANSVGLVNGNVVDLTRDVNGHIWVATAGGLNRVRGSGLTVEVDPYLDLGNYLNNDVNREFYTSSVIKPLPGSTYRRICAGEDRRQILVTADQGAALLTVGSGAGTAGPSLAGVYVYPNPYLGGQVDGGLKLGGLDTDAAAVVEIYNLDGQLVYRDTEVAPETGFWTGTNRVGNQVATGIYVVRVSSGGASRALTLSVVR